MISFVTGKPGAGKGLLFARLLVEELQATKRPILTNFAVELHPWVNGKNKPQLGLLAFLKREFGQTFDAEKRIFRVTDDQIQEFFLWRAVPNGSPTTFQLERAKCRVVETKEGVVKIMDFDTGLLGSSGSHFVMVDEGWKFWGSRNWQRTGEGLLFYNAQHRKTGDDVLIGCQHTKQIDAAVQRVAQDFMVCRNRSLLRMGLWRQQGNFKCEVYEDAPTGGANQKPMRSFTYRLDVDGIAQVYDTTAGVGLSGRMSGDMGRKRKGLPFWSLWVFAALIPVCAWFGISALLKRGSGALSSALGLSPVPAVGKAVPGMPVSAVSPVSGPGATNAALGVRSGAVAATADALRLTLREPLEVTGRVIWGENLRVFLSDGRTLRPGDGHLGFVGPQGCVVDGVLVPMRR